MLCFAFHHQVLVYCSSSNTLVFVVCGVYRSIIHVLMMVTSTERLSRGTVPGLVSRAGLRHVPTVRPNRAADFKGAAFLNAKKISI